MGPTNTQDNIVSNLDARLKRFLVARLRWRVLRQVQIEAYGPITARRHTLICAPTASGKTEAVFIPLFNRLLKGKIPPLFCLYISPLRALLDDCYERLLPWQKSLGIDIAVRHGEKQTSLPALCQQPPHLFMTTPESLEVILVYRSKTQKQNLFRNLQAVVVDEVHNFVSTHRGAQLSSLLTRLQPYVKITRPQVIGLSASVGDPEVVMEWLAAGERGEIVIVSSQQDVHYSVCYAGNPRDEKTATETLLCADKSLVFVPSRAIAEKLGSRLGRRLHKRGVKLVRVHHSSLDSEIKQKHQDEFKRRQRALMVATSTLELGIDIGDLDLVVHYHPPQSADSFLQRSGRAGRRGKPAKVMVVAHTTAELLIAAAQVSLALRSQVEPQQPLQWSYDVLLQQLLCLVREYGGVPRKQVWKDFFYRSSAFHAMDEADYLQLVDEWRRQELVELSARGLVTFGRLAELEFGGRNYMGILSSIPFAREFTVISVPDKRRIGTVDARFALTLAPGEEFLLGGEAWRVEHIRPEETKIFASPGSAEEPPRWSSGIGGLSYLVARESWRLITEGLPHEMKKILSPATAKRIMDVHLIASKAGLTANIIPVTFDPGENRWQFLTFAGHAVNALFRDMAQKLLQAYDARVTGFSLSLKSSTDAAALWEAIAKCVAILPASKLGEFVHAPKPLTKFGRFLPTQYLECANAELQYDLSGLKELMNNNRLAICSREQLMPLEIAISESR